MTQLNLQIFRWINGWPELWSPFLRFFSEAMNKGWFKVAVLILLIAMLAAGKQTRWTAILTLIALALANTSTNVWKDLVPEPRPFNDIPHVITRAGLTLHAGTASAHAANMMSVAAIFLYRQRWWGIPWLIAAILTGISRIYVGVHYPYQVLLGWLSGAACAAVVLWVYTRLSRPKSAVSFIGSAVSTPGDLAADEP